MPDLEQLRQAAAEYRHLKETAENARRRRDQEALLAVKQGNTWRAVGEAAGFTNSYIAYLQHQEIGYN